MSEMNERMVKVSKRFVARIKHLHNVVESWSKDGCGYTVENAQLVLKCFNKLCDDLQKTIDRVEFTPPETGTEVCVNNDSSDDHFNGTVLGGDSYEINVQVTPGFTVTAEWDTVFDRWDYTTGRDE